jgi:AcrR family transcriptional regulator
MATRIQRTERRTDALSKDRIVEAAIAILDADGEDALTFRALSARLATGSGAIYWHVANKGELLTAAAGALVERVMGGPADGTDPRASIRAIALGIFDTIDEHPWLGTQLVRAPWQAAMARIFEGIGRPLEALGVAAPAQFDCASVLLNYVLGVAGQNASNARAHAPGTERTAFLGTVAERWSELDPAAYPFVRKVAAQLPLHDDRAQFLAGIDLILAGIETVG